MLHAVHQVTTLPHEARVLLLPSLSSTHPDIFTGSAIRPLPERHVRVMEEAGGGVSV